MELQNDDFFRVEQFFLMSIQSNPHLDLWLTSRDAFTLGRQLLRYCSRRVVRVSLGSKA